ncbi:MAG: iron-containing alcohol dehydrogenase, partial [Eisenbergiella sp.]
ASKVLLHYGSGSIKKSGLYDTVTASLRESGISFAELGGVKPNPRLSLVHEGIALCKKENVDLILAVGGGSTIDSAKAIAMGVYYDGDIWEVYEQGKPVEKALPVATVLTIPAAGSESSGDSVITNEEKQLKFGYGSPLIRPLLSVMDPELFFTLPKNQLANGVADMMSHVFERYFTNTTHTDLTDGLCEVTLKTLMKNAPIALDDPQNYDAWAELGFSGTVAHNGLVGMDEQTGHVTAWHEPPPFMMWRTAQVCRSDPADAAVYKDNINMFVQFAVNVIWRQLLIPMPSFRKELPGCGHFKRMGCPAHCRAWHRRGQV